ncbi:MAG: hypothetical protein J7501_17170 [Bdellovibrio sp.]|nr:hypothetical protein [Bdellovibrio sp.]
MKLILVALFLSLSGFTCQKNEFFAFETSPIDCNEIRIAPAQTKDYEFILEEESSYCKGARKFSYLEAKDTVRGYFVNEQHGQSCRLKLLIVAVPDYVEVDPPVDPQKQANKLLKVLYSKDLKIEQLNTEPKKPQDFENICQK